jgi:hypothetical protein
MTTGPTGSRLLWACTETGVRNESFFFSSVRYGIFTDNQGPNRDVYGRITISGGGMYSVFPPLVTPNGRHVERTFFFPLVDLRNTGAIAPNISADYAPAGLVDSAYEDRNDPPPHTHAPRSPGQTSQQGEGVGRLVYYYSHPPHVMSRSCTSSSFTSPARRSR